MCILSIAKGKVLHLQNISLVGVWLNIRWKSRGTLLLVSAWHPIPLILIKHSSIYFLHKMPLSQLPTFSYAFKPT